MHPVACPDCDLLQTIPELPPGDKARCARCGCTVASHSTDPIERPLALGIAALLALAVANVTPLMGLTAVGRHASTTILGGAWQMWLAGEEIAALIVAFCAAIAPIGYVLCLIAVLLAARQPPAPRWAGRLLGWAERMEPWAMIEVMMLGILVALIKIAELATVEARLGMYAVAALVVLFPAIQVSFDAESIWERMQWSGDTDPGADPGARPAAETAPPT